MNFYLLFLVFVMQLLYEGNYEMATMCFEKAGDEYGEKLAKAAGLKATADRMHASNLETTSIACRQAAEIFKSVGKDEYVAECFYMLKEYERAGTMYFPLHFLFRHFGNELVKLQDLSSSYSP